MPNDSSLIDPSLQISVEDLYNVLMSEVEPDLTTDMIDLLDEMYAGESQEQKRARAERYAAALTIVYARLTSLLKLWKDCAMRAKTTFMTEIKKTHAKRDDSAMKDISDSIDAA
jgi:hypothetical protein